MMHSRRRAAMVVVGVFLGAAVARGQTPAGQAMSRTSDGTPDFSGIWQVMNTAAWDIQDDSAQKDVPAGMGGQ